MTDDWRRVPRLERAYNAYQRARYVENDCDHHGPYCKCDPPFHLRASTPAEEAIADRIYGHTLLEAKKDAQE